MTTHIIPLIVCGDTKMEITILRVSDISVSDRLPTYITSGLPTYDITSGLPTYYITSGPPTFYYEWPSDISILRVAFRHLYYEWPSDISILRVAFRRILRESAVITS